MYHAYYNERLPSASQTPAHGSLSENIFTGSNVYTFVPDGPAAPIQKASTSAQLIANGPLVYEARTQVSPWLEQRVRLYANAGAGDEIAAAASEAVQVYCQIGPMPQTSSGSVATRFDLGATTSLSQQGASTRVMESDSNFFQTIRRPLFNLTQPAVGKSHTAHVEPANETVVQSHYFPLSPGLLMYEGAADASAMSVLAARPVGGAGFPWGAEILQHRYVQMQIRKY